VIVLELEWQVRKRAMHLVNTDGKTYSVALREARSDTALLQRYFLTPVSMAAGAEAALHAAPKRPLQSAGSGARPADGATQPTVTSDYSKRQKKGDGKGKGTRKTKGGGKAEGKSKQSSNCSGWDAHEKGKTPDGRDKCYRYQRDQCNGRCGRVHVCVVCDGPPPKRSCPLRPQGQGDAAGSAARFN